MRNADFIMESEDGNALLNTCLNCAMYSKPSGANDTDIINGTRNVLDYGYSEFDNPFNKPFTKVVFITCYSLVFIFCVIGNLMVLFAIARSPRFRSMTNVFLANLAVADFFVGIFCVLPNLSTFMQQTWVLGRAMCKIYYYIWNVCYISRISILVVIAIERYLVILNPLKAPHILTRNRLTPVQIGIWLSALIYNIPYIVLYDLLTVGDDSFCYATMENERHLKWLSLTNIIVWYCTPLLVMAVLYFKVARVLWKTKIISALRLKSNTEYCMTTTLSIKPIPQSSYDQFNEFDNTENRSHRPNIYRSALMTSTNHVAWARLKVIRLLIFVVISFAFCVFPHMLKVLDHYWSFLKLSHETMLMLSPISCIFLYLNSALNPFLYAMFSSNFRRCFNLSIHCCKI